MRTRVVRGEPAGLPAEVTSFVGRRHELAELKRLLGTSHVVTVIGVGGVGKTRLALRAAEEVRRSFPGGVRLVELAALEDPDLLAQAVAEALSVNEHSTRAPLDALVERLHGRQTLIVLDNCEHVLAECAMLVDTLVRALPELRVLATSRQALGIDGERIVELAPLSMPTPGGDSPVPLAESDSVRLFAERAASVVPGFEVTEENEQAVAEICRRLDGLPLAIEMAAVRLRALSVRQVLERLDDRFRLLTGGSRAALPRQRTLRALFEWSYELCTEQERLLWQRVSVFAGGLDLEAAEHVCAGDGIAREDVLELVAGLVDKSVLLRRESEGVVRYCLLDTVRQFGRELLAASGDEATLHRRHRDYYRKITSRAWAELFSAAQQSWVERLQRDHANLRKALDWSLREPAEAETGLAMTAELLYHWSGYHLSEGAGWFDRSLAAATEPGEVRAHALWAGAWIALLRDDCATTLARLEEATAIAERLGLRVTLGYIAFLSGMAAVSGGDLESGMRRYEEAAAAHRAVGNPIGLALALNRLALANAFLGRPAARDLAEECVALCDLYGEGWHRAYALLALAIDAWHRDDMRAACEIDNESLRYNTAVGDQLGMGMNLEAHAWFAAGEQKYERAARLLGIVRTFWPAVGARLAEFRYMSRCHDECEAATREALGEGAFQAEVCRGAALTREEALAFALLERTPAARGPAPFEGRIAPLTRRETEIAHLVAEGLSNKDIAGRLVISQRTAEGHIEHILDKLGFKSRAQVAAWVKERLSERGDGPAADGADGPTGGPVSEGRRPAARTT
ncbi:ATP-binding protein [Microbispora catharanthi]|uniref:AAA family ATPase n=1 Tax=Microbispora catharanthi TaxID=1712871 RepID=A0A5N6BZH2_9ACTN|nr:LuxR C-terminal-related transcriptional regulator [Microbispora catharanthi]KAB8185936.1 AAA family ATPase [Microbispora catharanthi]